MAEQVIEKQLQIPDPVRHTQDTLADRYVGEDVVDEVRGTFGIHTAETPGTPNR